MPLLWTGMNSTSQESFEALIQAFGLAIRLWVVRGTKIEVGP